jgi:hypothetical protein
MSVVERPRRTVVNGLIGLGALAGFVGLLVAGPGVHVVARGHFVDYTEHEVLRARIFDSFSVLAAPETRANTDLMNVIVLCLLAGTAVLAAVLSPKGRMRWFFAIAAAGAFLASLEEGFELSETLGYNLGWFADHGIPVRKIDIVDAIPAAVFIWAFRDLLVSSTTALWFFVFGALLFLCSLVLEVVALTPVEDVFEVVASASLFLGFLVLAADRLGSLQERAR